MSKAAEFRAEAAKRILVKDGAYGTLVQAEKLDGCTYGGDLGLSRDQRGNNDLLNLTCPKLVGEICDRFAAAGADVLATNTFNANAISQADYGAERRVADMNVAAARITREVADRWTANAKATYLWLDDVRTDGATAGDMWTFIFGMGLSWYLEDRTAIEVAAAQRQDWRRGDPDVTIGQHLFAHVVVELLPPPAIAQRNGHGAFGVALTDDVTVELGDDLARGEIGVTHCLSLSAALIEAQHHEIVVIEDAIDLQAARVFAENILKQGGPSLNARINWAFERAAGRKPKTNERRVLLDLYRKSLIRFQRNPASARELVSVGDAPATKEISVARFGAMMTVARAILNLHEMITRN